MNAVGLEELWQIGMSSKPKLGVGPRGRLPIGKFGIGKLATYTLARRLTYICKQDGGFVSTSMDFGRLRFASRGGIQTPYSRRASRGGGLRVHSIYNMLSYINLDGCDEV